MKFINIKNNKLEWVKNAQNNKTPKTEHPITKRPMQQNDL